MSTAAPKRGTGSFSMSIIGMHVAFFLHAVTTNPCGTACSIIKKEVSHRSGIYIHLLDNHHIVVRRQLLHRHILADLLPRDDFLLEHGRGAALEQVAPLFLLPLVRSDVVAHQRRLVRRDDADVDVRPGAEIVEDASLDGLGCDLDRLFPRHLRPPLRFEYGHGGQGSAAHGYVGQLVGAAVGVHGEQAHACGVDAGNDQVCADVALVSEEMLLQHGHACDDAWLSAGGEGVELEVGGDEGGGEFGVGGRSGSGAPYLRGYVVELLTVLRGQIVCQRVAR